MSDNQFTILVEDIIEVYKYDSIEDIVECFKKVRQGKYDWGHEKRGVINMIVIGRWMAQHLEDKVVELEKSHEAIKKQSDYKLEQVDYEAYKQRQKEDKKKPDPTREETEYQKFKMEYLKNRKEPKL